ncbi:MAG: DUF4190 domain-containing protein [Chloroflexota bacterium]|nr:DUF4190 domain-containing protein [Dehalococcoidia bacterium]MDW8253219.1 DUF4190 domain-containing protein [Chloroflexota bacterium]
MTCRSCGATNPPEAVTCRVCGRPPAADPATFALPTEERVPPPRVLRAPPERPRRAAPPTSTLAVAALAAGIACWLIVPIVGAVVALVCGHLALREIAAHQPPLRGRELAVAGLVLAYVQLAAVALIGLGVCVFFAVTLLLVQGVGV